MREFFRGWKRKVGAVLFATALLSAWVWMRSQTCVDTFQMNGPAPWNFSAISGEGRLWMFVNQEIVGIAPNEQEITIVVDELKYLGLTDAIECKWRWHNATTLDLNRRAGGGTSARYWLITIVPSILAAVLFLSPPRQSPQSGGQHPNADN